MNSEKWYQYILNEVPTFAFSGGTTSIYIHDMNRAVHFYSQTLGLPLSTRIGDEWAELDAGQGFVIGLHPAHPDGPTPGSVGALNIEFEVPESLSLETVVADLQGRGVVFTGPISSNEHVRLASFSDPDGNLLLLSQSVSGAAA